MGYYIEGPLKKVEHIQALGGIPFTLYTPWAELPTGMVPVIVVSNGMFDAAGIAYNEGEYRAFMDPLDTRSKRGFLLPKDVVLAQTPGVIRVLEVKE